MVHGANVQDRQADAKNTASARQRAGGNVYRPVIVLAVAVLGVLALVVGVLVMRFDAVARASQIMVAQQGFINRLAEQAAVVRPRLNMPRATPSASMR